MLKRIDEVVIINFLLAVLLGALVPAGMLSMLAKGQFNIDISVMAIIIAHVAIGLPSIFYVLRRFAVFTFLSFTAACLVVIYLIIAIYALWMGYGLMAVYVPIYLSLISIPGIIVAWVFLRRLDRQ